MDSTPPQLSKKHARLVIFTMTVVVVALGIWFAMNSSNPYYQRSWKTNTDRVNSIKRKYQPEEEEKSKQPRPIGMRESEIKKYRGKGYDTY